MKAEGVTALRRELGGAPPGGLVGALQDAELGELAEAIHRPRRRQSAALAAAGERALGHLPRLVRGPVKKIAEVARELVDRGEYVIMGRFVGHLSDRALLACISQTDEASLLRIAFVLEGKERLDHVLSMLSRERLERVIEIAGSEQLWPEVLDLLAQVDEGFRGKLADIAAEQDDAVLSGLIYAAETEEIWDLLLPVLGSMSDAIRKRFASLDAIKHEAVLRSVAKAASRHDIWLFVLPARAAAAPGIPAHTGCNRRRDGPARARARHRGRPRARPVGAIGRTRVADGRAESPPGRRSDPGLRRSRPSSRCTTP
jgi:hypothetical protein